MDRAASPVGVCVRWTARLTSLLTLAFVVLAAAVPARPPTIGEAVALAFFPAGVLVGFAIAWWWDGLGGLVSLASLVAFYVWMTIRDGAPPRGPYFAILAAPALLFPLELGVKPAPPLPARVIGPRSTRPHWAFPPAEHSRDSKAGDLQTGRPDGRAGGRGGH
jgi:hypothetical protein